MLAVVTGECAVVVAILVLMGGYGRLPFGFPLPLIEELPLLASDISAAPMREYVRL